MNRRGNDVYFIEAKWTIGGQNIKLTTNEIQEIEDLVDKFANESEFVTSAERIIKELEINGKSCRLKVIIEIEEDIEIEEGYFEDIYTDWLIKRFFNIFWGRQNLPSISLTIDTISQEPIK